MMRNLLSIINGAYKVLSAGNLVGKKGLPSAAPGRILFGLLFVALPVFAKPITFDFKAVSLVAFTQSTYKSILNRDYVIAPEVLSMDRKITVSVRNVEERDVPAFVESILLQQGITVQQKGDVYYLVASSALPVVALAPVDLAKTLNLQPVSVAAKVAVAGPVAADAPGPVDLVRREDEETKVVVVMHRPAEFLATVVVAAFGPRAAMVAGASLVLSGSPGQITKMVALVESLDSSPAMFDVSVSWVEVARTSGAARGVSLVANVLGAKLGVSLGPVSSGGAISIQGAKFQAVLDVLDSDGRFKQVSNSRMVGDDREAMAMTVGDETPTVASSGKDNQGNAIQNIVYRPSGVIVNVLPKSLGNGKINLVVDGQISSFKATQTGVSGSPTLIKRQVKTVVTVAPGDVLLIGGLSDEQNTNTASGLGFLPAAWSLKNKSGSSTDLVLVLSAKLAGTK